MHVNELNTYLICVDQIKKAFYDIPTLKSNWENIDILLRSFMFKELLATTTIKGISIQKQCWSDYTTNLEVAVLGLLWCSGSQQQKCQLLCKLVNPSDEKYISHTNRELKFMFKKILYLSINMQE